jgi:hypothetical protein
MAEVGTFSEARGAISQPEGLAPRGAILIDEGYARLRERELPGMCSRAAAERPAIPWWLWWNVLSLDAPLVAVAWLAVFSRAGGVRLPIVNFVVLALAVWTIYTSDRLLDGWTTKNRGALQARHFFCETRRAALAALLGIAVVSILLLIFRGLPKSEVAAGLALGGIVGLYMAGIHVWQGTGLRDRTAGKSVEWVLPKEIISGVVFAGGTTLPLWSGSSEARWELLAAGVFFALLCCLNISAIECWEADRDDRACACGQRHFVRWTDSRIDWLAGGLVVAASSAAALKGSAGGFSGAFLAVALGGTFLLILNIGRERFSAPELRVLADVALLIPAGILLLLRGWGW